jgi:hypothetical protein
MEIGSKVRLLGQLGGCCFCLITSPEFLSVAKIRNTKATTLIGPRAGIA